MHRRVKDEEQRDDQEYTPAAWSLRRHRAERDPDGGEGTRSGVLIGWRKPPVAGSALRHGHTKVLANTHGGEGSCGTAEGEFPPHRAD
jgi:hypothetical protein